MPQEELTFRCCFNPPKKQAVPPLGRHATTKKGLQLSEASSSNRGGDTSTEAAPTPREQKTAVKYEHKVRVHKVGSELVGKYNLGIVLGEHGVGHICVQEVSGRYERDLVVGSPLIRLRPWSQKTTARYILSQRQPLIQKSQK